ncbi:MAG: glutaminyl-peptide cyclotransferase [Nitrospirae bacterium]|nr:glutaminyl-peptide cyclotransferase [Nitrospirota bacterium]
MEIIIPRKHFAKVKLLFLLLACGILLLARADFSYAVTKTTVEEFSIPLPGLKPQGITWDGKHLWVVEKKKKKVYRLDPRSGAILQTFAVDLKKPKGLAFDGKSIWVADEETMKIHALDPQSGQIVKTIPMEISKEKGFKSFEGMTWDGKHLWTAIYAGFSSSFNQIDTESGRIVKSIFAECNPRGIASDGKYIWSICYNGENLPSKIDKRKILEKEHEMLRSRMFIRDIEGRDPVGLAYDGKYLWYTDRQLKKAFMIYPGNLEKK